MGKSQNKPNAKDNKPTEEPEDKNKYRTLILTTLITTLGTIMVALITKCSIPPPPPTPTPTLSPTQTNTPAPTSTPILTATPTPACPYQGFDDAETFVNLIHAEADAVNMESMEIIQKIFAPDAVIYDVEGGVSWPDPVAKYQGDLFPNANSTDVQHFGIVSVGKSPDGAFVYYVSGSSGSYTNKNGGPYPYYNGSKGNAQEDTKYGSDHWTFQQNVSGCWVIKQFQYRAGNAPFPP